MATTLRHNMFARSYALPRTFLRRFSAFAPFNAPGSGINRARSAAVKLKERRKRRKHLTYKQYDLKDIQQFSLCDAMRYIRAFEVGRDPKVPKYECHIKLNTRRDGPVVRGQLRLPHEVKPNVRVCVICPPDSPIAQKARDAGAVLVGEEDVFEVVKAGKINFDRCIAHPASLTSLNQADLGRILGPKGLMPSVKLGSVVDNVALVVKNLLGSSAYRERQGGIVRMAVGQLGFSAEQLRDNIRAFVERVKEDAAVINDEFPKKVAEVVLSSTQSPGFSLNGDFRSENSPSSAELSKQ